MACFIKKNESGIVTEVRLPDGKTMSKAYYDILQNIQEGIPSEYVLNALASLNTYVGKYITDTNATDQKALGLYMQLYDTKFKQWYGDWVEEPTINEDLTITNNKGETRSIFDFGKYTNSVADKLLSARTRSTKRLIKQVEITVKELKDRMSLAIDAREKSKLNSQYSKDQKIERERYYNNLVKRMKQQIETLTRNNDIDYVLAQGLSDIQVIKDTLSGPVVSLTEIRFVDDIVQAWKNIDKILGTQVDDIVDENQKEKAEKILAEVGAAERRIANLAKKQIIEAYNNSMPASQELTVKDLDAFKDVSAWKSLTRDITTVDSKAIGYLSKIVNQANLKITKEHNNNYEAINESFEKIKDHPEVVANGFDIFVKQQTNKGLTTLGLRGRFSQDFYNAIKGQSNILNKNLDIAGEDKEGVKKAYNLYNSWIAKNTVLFNSAPFINAANYTDAQRKEVVDNLKSQQFTEDEIADMIREADKRYKAFQEYAENYKTRLYLDISAGDIVLEEGQDAEKFIDEKVAEWKKLNDPVDYIEHINAQNAGKLSTYTAYKGGRYAVKFPQKKVDGKDSGYYDENFTKIASDKKLYDFYIFFRDFINDQLSYLPQEQIDELQSNFLPVITERLAKEYAFTSLKETGKNLGEWFFKQLTSVDYKDNKRIDPITGKERRGFTTKFINEEIDPDNRSKDLVLMMKLFSDMALIYKHKMQIQDQVDSINDLVQSTDASIVEDKFGERVEKGSAPKNLQKMVGSAILRSFYEVAPEAEGVNKQRRFYTALELLSFGAYKSEAYEKAKKLQERIETIGKKLESDELKDKDREQLEKQLNTDKKDYYALGGRNLSMSSVLDGLNKLTRQKGIGFNPFSAFRNVAIGGINNFIHAYGGEDFTTSDIFKASGIVKDSMTKYITWGNVNSINAIKILKFNLDSKIVDGEDEIYKDGILGINKKSSWETVKKYIPSPFGLMRSTDFLFKSQTAVSMMIAQKIETSKGTFNLFEVMDENLQFNSEKYGDWNTEKNGGLEFEDFYDKFSAKVGQVAKKLHGFAGGGQSLAGKDSMFGRMLFVFRSWLPETVATRFEGKRYDPILERDVEGYYKTFWNRIYNGEEGIRVFGAFKDLFTAAMNKQVAGLTKEEQANLKKMFMEMSAIVSLMGIYLALSATVGDDEDDKWKRLALNQLSLLSRDLTYYIDPSSFSSLTTNLVPALATLQQSGDAVSAIGNYLVGTENGDGDPLYDGERTLLKISKSLPYVNNVNRVIYYSGRLGNVR